MLSQLEIEENNRKRKLQYIIRMQAERKRKKAELIEAGINPETVDPELKMTGPERERLRKVLDLRSDFWGGSRNINIPKFG